ncbi:hypothetical protein Ahy_A07g032488 [Arachis hypogaea]|uniref:DUF8040 domain-containing protein n=1 Tax=Arachis hypogaea TaxID=3818 RepID=A0A445C717_ARAHY|nr:hypothetical protein Ahy_A07g032488 [Arachis hypogaea]
MIRRKHAKTLELEDPEAAIVAPSPSARPLPRRRHRQTTMRKEGMERLKIMCFFYGMMRLKHDNLMLNFVLTLFVYFRNRSSGQVSLDRRMNSRITCDALECIIGEGNRNCIWELRIKTNAFTNLCELLQVQGGLCEDGQVSLPEQVATLLIILAHHKKNCSLQVRFCRSGEIVSKYFNKVLKAVIRMQKWLFAKASPVEEDCIGPTWRKKKEAPNEFIDAVENTNEWIQWHDNIVRMDKSMWADEETKTFVGFMEERVVDSLRLWIIQTKNF